MHPLRTRVVALVSSVIALACLVALVPATVSAGAEPSQAPPTCTPSAAPAVVGAARDRLVVTVPQCAGATGVSGYRLLRYEGTGTTPSGQVDVPAGQVEAEVTGLAAGSVQRFAVVARNADGVGPATATSPPAPVPFVGVAAFSDRQHRDLAGRAPTAGETAAWATRLGDGSVTPAALIDELQAATYWQRQSPVIRLYQAYFLRLPDIGGLDYWVGQSRSGKSLNDISQAFSASPEFRTLYGSLTNRQFVERIYQNILGRAGEPAGVDYWTGELDSRRKGRGAVMVGFSESPEYRTGTLAQVDVVNIATGMLRRVPTAAEVTAWKALARTALITNLLGSAEYEARVRVVAPPAATTAALPDGVQGTAYPSTTLTALAGTPPLTWSVATGALPAGLALSAAGVVSGTPTAAGTSTVGIRVADAAGRATTRSYSILVAPPGPTITTAALPGATVGVLYSQALAATGGTTPYTWSLVTGSLPSGITLSPGGSIGGTASAPATAAVTVKVTDATSRTATRALTLVVATAPSVTTATLPAGTQGVAYSQTLAASGGVTPYTWAVSAGSLPAGLSLSTSGSLSGTPTGTSTATFTVRVTDSGGRTGTRQMSIAVATPPSITTASLPGASQGTAYSRTLAATGGAAPYTWSISVGSLPAGLTLSGAVIGGTPTGSGTSTFTVRVTDSAGRTATKVLSIAVTVPPGPVVTTSALPGAQVGVGYAHQITATSGTPPYTWAVTAGGLPGGITLDPATGLLAGTAATTTTATFTVRVTDSASRSSTKELTLAVTAATGWPQTRADEGHRGWNPNETTITPANGTGTRRVWAGEQVGRGRPVVDGGTAYVIRSDPNGDRLEAVTLATGAVQWTLDAPADRIFVEVALTPTAFVIAASDRLLAFSRSSRALLWDTGTNDPGTYASRVVVIGSTAVVEGQGAVTGYRLSDGERLWQVLTPSGAGSVRDLAASGNRVVVVYDDRVRALNLANGSQAWSRTANTSSAVITDGAVFVADAGTLRRFALSDGAPGWSTTGADGFAASVALGADATHLYMSTYSDGSRNIEARRLTDGAHVWSTPAYAYIYEITIAGDLVWANDTEFYVNDFSRLAAFDRATGETVFEQTFPQSSGAALVAAGGHVLYMANNGYNSGARGGLWAFGLAPPLPVIPAQVLSAGRTGSAYSHALTATEGTAPYRWSRTAGTLPAGLSLGATGTITGTATAAGTSTFTATVTDARGRTASRELRLQVDGPAPTTWSTRSSGTNRNPTPGFDDAIDIDGAATIAGRWRTAPATTAVGGALTASSGGVVVVGDRMYAVDEDGVLKAWSTTGTTTNRAPLWTKAAPGDFVTFRGGVSESGGTLFVTDSAQSPTHLYAIRASDGVTLWTRNVTTDVGVERAAPLVVGGLVIVLDLGGGVRAYDASTGAPAWGGAVRSVGTTNPSMLATDGTRIYGQAGCKVTALTVASGATAWTGWVDRARQDEDCNAYSQTAGHAVVASGVVYAGSDRTTTAFDAATGAVRWRSATPGLQITATGGVIVVGRGNGTNGGPVGLDPATGERVWATDAFGLSSEITVVGDLAVATTWGTLYAFDIRSGELLLSITAWGGAFPTMYDPAPVVAGGRIYVLTPTEGIRTFAPPA